MFDNAKRSYIKLRVFVASPGDMATERSRLQTVVDALNRRIADYFGLTLELLDWRTHVMPLTGRPEEVVLQQLPVQTWDIFVGILWLRFGSPTGARRPGTNEPFYSGTEEEFYLAHDAALKCGRPKVLFYRCKRIPSSLDEIDPDQLKRVKLFFSEFQPSASHPGLPQEFRSPEEFERRVMDDLTQLLISYGREVMHHEQPPPPALLELTSPKSHNNLPRREPFFGRNEEMDKALKALDPADRTWGLVIDGIGGIGKTALAVEVAHRCKDDGLFDAFIYVTAKSDRLKPTGIQRETPGATTLDEFINEAARTLGQTGIVRLSSTFERQTALRDALRGRRVLLVFDNLETLPQGERDAVSEFVSKLPDDCKAIVTSRWRAGETARPLRLDRLKWEEARELIQAQVEMYEEDLRALKGAGEAGWKQLYDQAGGSPLVLLCAVGLIRVCKMSFEQALGAVCDGSRETDLNQFIYGLTLSRLDSREREMLYALSLFGGPAPFEALAATTSLGRHAADTVLERLRGFSLVNVVRADSDDELDEDRYTLHPLTKRLARSNLAEDHAAAAAIEARFIKHWVTFAVSHGVDGDADFDQLESEWANLEAAARLLIAAGAAGDGGAEAKAAGRSLVEFAGALRDFLDSSGRSEERILICERAYDLAYASGDWEGAGWFAYAVAFDHLAAGRLDEASSWTEVCGRSWAKGAGGKEQIALYRIRGLVAQGYRRYIQAKGLLNRSLKIALELNLGEEAASTLNELSNLAHERKKYKDAKDYLKRALDIAVKLGDAEGQVVYGANLGSLALEEKKADEAFDWFNQAAGMAKEFGLVEMRAGAQYGLARALYAQGRSDMALELAQEVLPLYERLHLPDLNKVRELVEELTPRPSPAPEASD